MVRSSHSLHQVVSRILCFTELEPKNLQTQHIYRLLDLAATQDDQHDVRSFPLSSLPALISNLAVGQPSRHHDARRRTASLSPSHAPLQRTL